MTLPRPAPANSQTPRPFIVTILSDVVLILVGLNLLRGVYAIARWNFLAELPGILPGYLAFSGLAWAILGSVAVWGLRRACPWAPRFTQGITLLYTLYYWLDHTLLARGLVTATNWPIPAALTLLLLAYGFMALHLPASRLYFDSTHTPRPKPNHPAE